MKYIVILLEEAERDLKIIFNYVAFNLLSTVYAERILDELEEAIISLKLFPYRYKPYEYVKLKKVELRMMPVDNYCIFYFVDENRKEVYITRVLSSKMNIKSIL